MIAKHRSRVASTIDSLETVISTIMRKMIIGAGAGKWRRLDTASTRWEDLSVCFGPWGFGKYASLPKPYLVF